jgi:hypothetical protein
MPPYKHLRREFPENQVPCAAICKHPTSNIDHLILSHFIGATAERRLPNGNYFCMMQLE